MGMNLENAWATGRAKECSSLFDCRAQSVKISVVLPVKNGGLYIDAAIDSILVQTFRDFELLVIDDGSTDNTLDILTKFQEVDPRVSVLNNPATGLVDALNFGIRSACAPLIARMDADDIALPVRLQRQYDFLVAHPHINLVGSQVAFIDENGAVTGETTTLPENPDAVANTLLKYCCIRHPTVLMRRTAFEQAGGYRAQVPAAEDLDLWLRMAEHGRLVNMPDVLLQYRRHAGQVSQAKIWTQRLSRNLAIISAMERRAGRPNLLDNYSCFKREEGRHECLGLGCPDAVCNSLRAFNAARALLSDASHTITQDDAHLFINYVSQYSIGDGKSNTLRALLQLCRLAARQRALITLGRALRLALRIHPTRALRLLFTHTI